MMKEYTQVIHYLIVYLLCSIVFGIYKAETVIQYFPKEYTSTIRVSSYASILISNSIAMIVLFFLLSLVFYLCQYFKLEITSLSFIDASTSLISLFILTELVKLILVFLFLKEEAVRFNLEDLDFQSQLNHTQFYKLANWVNIAAIPIAITTFYTTLYRHRVGIRSNMICSTFLLILLGLNMLS